MEAKLIKYKQEMFTNYILKNEDGDTIATSRYPFATETEYLAKSKGITLQRLSHENCEEEFAKAMGVVDVEKFAEEIYGDESEITNEYDLNSHLSERIGFRDGFNKAMELNKDKVFTLEDVESAMRCMISQEIFYGETHEETQQMRQTYIKSYIDFLAKEPTEIEVEIEMEEKYGYNLHSNPIEKEFSHLEPKLDSEGQLIVKKK